MRTSRRRAEAELRGRDRLPDRGSLLSNGAVAPGRSRDHRSSQGRARSRDRSDRRHSVQRALPSARCGEPAWGISSNLIGSESGLCRHPQHLVEHVRQVRAFAVSYRRVQAIVTRVALRPLRDVAPRPPPHFRSRPLHACPAWHGEPADSTPLAPATYRDVRPGTSPKSVLTGNGR